MLTEGVGMGTVLVVEDEPIVRMMAVDCAEEAGFEVIEASDGDEALRVLHCGTRVDIVFTDIRMPGSTDGVELTRLIEGKWPAIKVIVTSGHAAADEAIEAGAERFFAKPYRADDLILAFHQMARA
jgi:two-component system, response regulator PdtaR